MADEKKSEESKDRYFLAEVPTETGIMIQDKETETVLSVNAALTEILNKLDIITKKM